MYKDKDKQKEANRERQRRYKARQKGVTSEGVTEKALPTFDDLPLDVQQSIDRLSSSPEDKASRMAIALDYQEKMGKHNGYSLHCGALGVKDEVPSCEDVLAQQGELPEGMGVLHTDFVRGEGVSIKPTPANFGQPDCECRHCANNRNNGSRLVINHGPYKPVSELKDNEVNRVSLPGDVDYRGAGHGIKDDTPDVHLIPEKDDVT